MKRRSIQFLRFEVRQLMMRGSVGSSMLLLSLRLLFGYDVLFFALIVTPSIDQLSRSLS